MNCTQCGAAIPAGTRFCGRCGAAAPAEAPQPAATPPQAAAEPAPAPAAPARGWLWTVIDLAKFVNEGELFWQSVLVGVLLGVVLWLVWVGGAFALLLYVFK